MFKYVILLSSIFCTSMSLADTLTVPDDHSDIQDAIDAAISSDSSVDVIEIKPGTYTLSESVILKSGISLKGLDTERTIITADSNWENQVLLLADGDANNIKIQNLTFKNADIAFETRNGTTSGIEITNNIFFMGVENDAIVINDTSTPIVKHNVFYKNDYAISGGDSSVSYTYTIKNNIFYDNENITTATVTQNSFSYNCYYANTNEWDSLESTSLLQDPLFALINNDDQKYDFHLQADSPCRDAGDDTGSIKDPLDGTRLDIGAYGGSHAQLNPSPVEFTAEASTADNLNYSITISWQPTLAYEVVEKEIYRLYFGESSNSYQHESGTQTSPVDLTDAIDEADGTKSITLSGFQVASSVVDAPGISQLQAFNQRLEVSWNDVEDASGYSIVFVGSDGSQSTIDVGDVTSYTIKGLTNGVSYDVSVSAYHQPTLFFYLRAVEGLSESGYESTWVEEFEQEIDVGEKLSSPASTAVTATPDEIQPYPSLPGEGCFIATATYGSYDARQVQILRDFRDQVLLTTNAGKRLVGLYYKYGPIAADWVNENPSVKPLIQAILYPYLLLSIAFLELGTVVGMTVVFLLIFAGLMLLRRGNLYAA